MPTFKQQFDKLTEAYIKGEVDPFKDCACFVGNLLNGDGYWGLSRNLDFDGSSYCILPKTYEGWVHKFGLMTIKKQSEGLYNQQDIIQLELLFLNTYVKNGGTGESDINEDALFKAFEVTLDLLKKIHISKGEQVEDCIFQKRIVSV